LWPGKRFFPPAEQRRRQIKNINNVSSVFRELPPVLSLFFLLHDSMLEKCKTAALYDPVNISLDCVCRSTRKKAPDMSMTESQDEETDVSPRICLYCKKHQNDRGGWGESAARYRLMPDYQKKQGICPGCLRKYYPAVYVSLCRNGKINNVNG